MITRSAIRNGWRASLRATTSSFQPPTLTRAIRTPRHDEGGLDVQFVPLKSQPQKEDIHANFESDDWREKEFLNSGVSHSWIPSEIDGDADIPNYDRYLMSSDKTLTDFKLYEPEDPSHLTDRQRWMMEALKTQRLREATSSAQWKNFVHDFCDDHDFPKWFVHIEDEDHPTTQALSDHNEKELPGTELKGSSGVAVAPNVDLDFWGVTKEGIRYGIDVEQEFPKQRDDQIWIKDKSVPEMWMPDKFVSYGENYVKAFYTMKQRSKTTSKGRIASFSCLCIAGNKNGASGFGIGKAEEPADARAKAMKKAQENMIAIPLHRGRGIFRATEATINSYTLKVWPRPEGYGLVADPFMTLIFESFGIKDAAIRNIGGRNPFIGVQAAYLALSKLADSSIHDVAHDTGRRVVDIVPEIDGKCYAMPQGYDSRQRGRAKDILKEFQEKHMIAQELNAEQPQTQSISA